MTDNPAPTAFDPRRGRDELVRLVRRMQVLSIEVGELRKHASTGTELQAKERTLEQLRWQLAAVARRTATDDLGNAA
jgi:hypothetical protein